MTTINICGDCNNPFDAVRKTLTRCKACVAIRRKEYTLAENRKRRGSSPMKANGKVDRVCGKCGITYEGGRGSRKGAPCKDCKTAPIMLTVRCPCGMKFRATKTTKPRQYCTPCVKIRKQESNKRAWANRKHGEKTAAIRNKEHAMRIANQIQGRSTDCKYLQGLSAPQLEREMRKIF